MFFIQSSGNKMTLLMKTDDTEQYGGFVARISRTQGLISLCVFVCVCVRVRVCVCVCVWIGLNKMNHELKFQCVVE